MPRKRGPAPQTADVIELHGNPGKFTAEEIERRRSEEVKAAPLRPGPPADLSPYARDCWRMLEPELRKVGLLSVLDSAGFRMACETYALALYALDELKAKKADGTVDQRKRKPTVIEVDVAHGGNLRRHPAIMVYFSASKEFRQWCVEFGLTPSARVSLRPGAVHPPKGAGADDDDDEGFFGT